MKNYLKGLFVGLFMFLLIYLLSAFYNMSFDISIWSDASRFTVSTMGGILSIFIGDLIAAYSNISKR